MEQLNKIELSGNVGIVRLSKAGENEVARFSLATNYMYKNKDGEAIVETTWHNVVAWAGKNMPDLEKIQKGCGLYVCGRLKSSKYKSNDGTEKQSFEVIANKIVLYDSTVRSE